MTKRSNGGEGRQGGQIAKLGGLGDRTPVLALLNDEVEVGSFVCNFDHTDGDNAQLLFLSEKPADVSTEEALGQVLPVVGWVCTKFHLTGKKGEDDRILIKTTLILKDRRTYSTMSKGVAKSIDLMRSLADDQLYDPPMSMRLIGSDVGHGADMLMLIPAEATL